MALAGHFQQLLHLKQDTRSKQARKSSSQKEKLWNAPAHTTAVTEAGTKKSGRILKTSFSAPSTRILTGLTKELVKLNIAIGLQETSGLSDCRRRNKP